MDGNNKYQCVSSAPSKIRVIEKSMLFIMTMILWTSLAGQDTVYFLPNLQNTGVHHLTVFMSTVTGLSTMDEIGLFDENGLISNQNCNSETGPLLVGAGVYQTGQMEIVSIGSIDNCAFGGIQLPGYVIGHDISARVWKSLTNTEYPVHLIVGLGNGVFGEVLTVIDDILYFMPAWYGFDPVTPMTIEILQAEIQGFLPDAGDEIAVFDNAICVGSIKYTTGWEQGLTIYAGADITGTETVEGFTESHDMIFKLWDASDAFEENWVSLDVSGDGVFTPNGFSQISVTGLSTDDGFELSPEFFSLTAYPNPFNSTVKIDYEVHQMTHLIIDIVDITGRQMSVLFRGRAPAGSHSAGWYPGNVYSGIFYVRIQANGISKSLPVLYLK